jgi:hypothetical protein
MISSIGEVGGDLLSCEDPLEAEVGCGMLLGIGAIAGSRFEDALADVIIPAVEAQASPGALAMLLLIGALDQGRCGTKASAAAERLVDLDVPRPTWAAELDSPVTGADYTRLSDSAGDMAILACSFRRSGRSHGIVITVDGRLCGAASEIGLLDVEQLPLLTHMMQDTARGFGTKVKKESLSAADFRWHVEAALDARAEHDKAHHDEPDKHHQEDGPGYHAHAVIVRARMNTLPHSGRLPTRHPDHIEQAAQLLFGLAARAGRAGGLDAVGVGSRMSPGTRSTALPRRRTKSDGPAPIYQIKVSLRGAKPPIWRRLEVPADIGLTKLHHVIQTAFDWDDCHLHAFETPYGTFGIADPDLGHRSEARVTLEQVAPVEKGKICYLYDFGDDWQHDIVLEKVLQRDDAEAYPRCTGGRRAAPPEDCGGVWGYAELVEILQNPGDPDHEPRLKWMGLAATEDFDPEAFDAEAVSNALRALRR